MCDCNVHVQIAFQFQCRTVSNMKLSLYPLGRPRVGSCILYFDTVPSESFPSHSFILFQALSCEGFVPVGGQLFGSILWHGARGDAKHRHFS